MDEDFVSVGQLAALAAWLMLLCIPLALLVAAVLRRYYVQAVIRQQNTALAEEAAEPPPAAAASAPPSQALLIRRDLPEPDDGPAQPVLALRGRLLRTQTAFGIGLWLWLLLLTVVAASVVSAPAVPAQEAAAAAAGAPPSALAGVALNASLWTVSILLLFGPPLLAALLQRGLTRRGLLLGLGVVAGLMALGALAAASHRESAATLRELAVLTAVMVAPALLLAGFLAPRLRGVAPPVMAALATAVLTLSVLLSASVVAAIVLPEDPEPLTRGDTVGVLLVLLLMVAAALALAWFNLQHLARQYERKVFSELQLSVDTFWGAVTVLMAALTTTLTVASSVGDEGAQAVAWMMVGFLGYRWGLRRRLRRRLRNEPAQRLPPLLLLRLFRAPESSKLLMDRLLTLWRFGGPLWMIGGPDLAAENIEPHEFFAFVRRRLGELFLHRRRDVAARLERLDGARDPDGRFRVNELFCLGSCWQEAVTQLMASAGLVLLDLRGYREDGPYGGGLRYEIQQVFDRVPLARVVVLTQGDNAAAIDRALQTAWSQLALSSPNRALGGPVLRVIELKGAGMREARRVLALLAAAAVLAGAADVAAVPAAPAAVLQPAVPGGA